MYKRQSYTKTIENKQVALLRVKKEMKQTVTTGTTERNWVTLFKQYENVEELNRRVLMSLVDRILIHENHVWASSSSRAGACCGSRPSIPDGRSRPPPRGWP